MSRKETHRLLSKGLSNIYLKVTNERLEYSNILGLKNLSPGQYWKALTHADTTEFSNFLLQLKSQKFGSKTVCDSF